MLDLGNNYANQLLYFTYIPANIYPYVSLGAYALVTIILAIQIERTRSQRWLHIMTGTALAETIGYVFRIVCLYNTKFASFVVMTLFLLLPPNALALANYKLVGKIIAEAPPVRHSKWRFWLKPKFVHWFYFSSDLFSIAMQGAGGGMLTTDNRDIRNIGKYVALVGLVVQLFFFGCFLVTTCYVWAKPIYTVEQSRKDKSPRAAKIKVLSVAVITTILLYVRSIYRVVEFADGYGGKIYSAEWAFYVFDTIVIFIAFVVYIVLFIGYNFPRHAKSSKEGMQPISSIQ